MERFFVWKIPGGGYIKVNNLKLSKVNKVSKASHHASKGIANTWKSKMESKFPGVKLVEAELVEKLKS